jgi:hypothetical protein
VIILESATTEDRAFDDQRNKKRPSKVKTFQQWFAKTEANLFNFELYQVK